MFFNKLKLFLESNIKQYKDEKRLEVAERKEILLEIQNKKNIKEIYELDKKLAENEYSAERKLISRLKEALTGYVGKVVESFKKYYE